VRPPAIWRGKSAGARRRAAGCCRVYKAGFHYNFGNTTFRRIVEEGNYFIYGNASQTLHYLDAERRGTATRVFTLSGAPGNRNRDEFEATAIVRVVVRARRDRRTKRASVSSSRIQQRLCRGAIDNGSRTSMARRRRSKYPTSDDRRWLVLQPDVHSSSTRSETAAATWR